jgi:hypothetical protein
MTGSIVSHYRIFRERLAMALYNATGGESNPAQRLALAERIERLHTDYGHEPAVREQLAKALYKATVVEPDPAQRARLIERLAGLSVRFPNEPFLAEVVRRAPGSTSHRRLPGYSSFVIMLQERTMTRYPYLPGTVPVVDPDAPGQRAARFLDDVQARCGDRPRAPFAETWGQSHAGQPRFRVERENSTPMTLKRYWSGVTAIASGPSHCLVVRNGAAYAWGSNRLGQLGVGDTEDRRRPVAVAGLSDGVTHVSGSYTHSMAIRHGGVYAWGSNQSGQLGNGTTEPSCVPIAVPGLSDGVTAIVAGSFFSLAVRNGAVYAWGSNTLGNLPASSATIAARRLPSGARS